MFRVDLGTTHHKYKPYRKCLVSLFIVESNLYRWLRSYWTKVYKTTAMAVTAKKHHQRQHRKKKRNLFYSTFPFFFQFLKQMFLHVNYFVLDNNSVDHFFSLFTLFNIINDKRGIQKKQANNSNKIKKKIKEIIKKFWLHCFWESEKWMHTVVKKKKKQKREKKKKQFK